MGLHPSNSNDDFFSRRQPKGARARRRWSRVLFTVCLLLRNPLTDAAIIEVNTHWKADEFIARV